MERPISAKPIFIYKPFPYAMNLDETNLEIIGYGVNRNRQTPSVFLIHPVGNCLKNRKEFIRQQDSDYYCSLNLLIVFLNYTGQFFDKGLIIEFIYQIEKYT